MTASTSVQSNPRKTVRPSVARLLASKYVDILICGFIAWVVCFTFSWQSLWATLTLFLWVGEVIWCRDRLNPTAGEYCLGIRYLTSSSSQVVADIQVIHNKLRLNGFLVTAGVVEMTLAFLFFGGWTFLGKVAFLGFAFGPPLSLLYWAVAGFAFFLCCGSLLSGSKLALWIVPIVHACFLAEFFRSYPAWKNILQNDFSPHPWISEATLNLVKSESFIPLGIFVVWSFFVFASILLSRKHLVN
jgi:hypothetical protein